MLPVVYESSKPAPVPMYLRPLPIEDQKMGTLV